MTVPSGRLPMGSTLPTWSVAENEFFSIENVGFYRKFINGTFLATVDKLTGAETFRSNHGLFADTVAIRVAEGHHSQWGTTTGIVDNVLIM